MHNKKVRLPQGGTAGHLQSLDFLRNIAMLAVILYHCSAAYSALAPWWAIHDGTTVAADFVRQVFDVIMMPAFFFLSGWFFLSSIRKRGFPSFMGDKLKRLGTPWLLLMLTLAPLIFYVAIAKAPGGSGGQSLLNFWLNGYLSNVVNLRYGASPLGTANQLHLWYISLLLVFFLVAGVLYTLVNKKRGMPESVSPAKPDTAPTLLKGLLALALLTTAASFAASLLFPDTYWFSAGLLVQFQPTKVLVYALYFAFGIFAGSRKWFAERSALTRPLLWGLLSLVLTAVYLVASAQVAAHPDDSQTLPPLLLLGYSASRSLLCVSVIVFLLSVGERLKKASALNGRLAAQSFNMYLVHFFLVIFFQGFFSDMTFLPAAAKFALVIGLAVPLSYWLARAVSRFPKSFAVGVSALFVLAAAFLH
jgi:glucans biosynthesis protein C